jgi:PAS domain-containing protein
MENNCALNDYCETILNIVMDVIEDIIIIHDSEYTIVWMNNAGLKAFNMKIEDVIGSHCHSLFCRSTPCDDYPIPRVITHGSIEKSERIIPTQKESYDCTSTPVRDEDGNIQMVVQHLRAKPAPKKAAAKKMA